MIVVTLVAVICGVFAVAPGLGIPMAIIMLPVFVRTSMVVRQRETRGEDVSFATRAALFAGSFWTTVVILVVVGIASVGTFCGVCLGVYFGLESSGGSVAEVVASIIAGIATTITTILAIWFSVRLIRRRWKRDVGQAPERRS